MGRNLVLTVGYDPDPDCPMDWDGSWKLYSFNRRSIFWRHPDNFIRRVEGDKIIPANIGLQRKLDRGLAFWLQYYEHGLARYDIRNEGPQCAWDTVSLAGLLIWERPAKELGLKTFEERRKSAKAFLELFNKWMIGDVYTYCLCEEVYNAEREVMEERFVDSLCGIYEIDVLEEYVKEHLLPDDRLTVQGEAAYLVNYRPAKDRAASVLRREPLPNGSLTPSPHANPVVPTVLYR